MQIGGIRLDLKAGFISLPESKPQFMSAEEAARSAEHVRGAGSERDRFSSTHQDPNRYGSTRDKSGYSYGDALNAAIDRIGYDGAQMTRAEFEASLTGNSLPKDYQLAAGGSMWTDYTAFMLGGEWTPGNNGNVSIADSMRQMAAQYVAVKGRLQADYSGKEQEEQLEKMEAFFAQRAEKNAVSFADTVNRAIPGGEDWKSRVLDSFEEQKRQYEAFASENPNYAGVQGTEKEWLTRDSLYMAAELQRKAELGKTQGAKDLDALGTFAVQIANGTAASPYDNSEEGIGFSKAMESIKTEVLIRGSGASTEMAVRLRAAVENRFDTYMNRYDAEEEKFSAIAARQIYKPLDRSAVDSMAQWMRKAYENTGNILEAVRKGTQEMAARYYESAGKKENENVVRYYGGSNFMKSIAEGHFFIRYANSYHSTTETVINEWNAFAKVAAPDMAVRRNSGGSYA